MTDDDIIPEQPTDAKTHLPRLRYCPLCGKRCEGEQLVDVVEEERGNAVSVSEKAKPGDVSFDTTTCVRFVPCGHAFGEESIEATLREGGRVSDATRNEGAERPLQSDAHVSSTHG